MGILKDPLKVDHEGRPAMNAVLNLNQPNLSPLSDCDLESESEDENIVEDVISPISNFDCEEDIEKYFKTEDLNVTEITNSRASSEESTQAKEISNISLTPKK